MEALFLATIVLIAFVALFFAYKIAKISESNINVVVKLSEKTAITLENVVKQMKDKDYKVVELLLDGTFARNIESFAETRQNRMVLEAELEKERPAGKLEPVVVDIPKPKTQEEIEIDFEKEYLNNPNV